jgi:ATP-dependent RNA helicase RhlE
MKFDAFDLHQDILGAIALNGFEVPTPIQEKAIPPILTGCDLLGLAQTGTGKTAAFALPIIHQLMTGPRRCVRALVLAPTRELAAQIHEAFRCFSKGTGLRSVVIYGGVSVSPQIEALKRGVEIVVACPGRLLDHISQRNIDFSRLETLVIDEADRMFDMGFLPDIRRVAGHLPKKRQTLLFSATMPDDIRRLADEMLHEAVTVQISHTKPIETVSHALYPVAHHLKTALLRELLKTTDTGSVLVFTRTKHRAERLARQLSQAGFRATSLQGDLSQSKREKAIDGFRKGAFQILVATDIAARGIDVSAISHVINFDMPDTADAYTHRIGRTGRAEKTGDAFTFVTGEDTEMVRTIEKILGERLIRNTLPGFDYNKPNDSPAQAGNNRSRQQAPRPARPEARRSEPGRPRDAGRYRPQTLSR